MLASKRLTLLGLGFIPLSICFMSLPRLLLRVRQQFVLCFLNLTAPVILTRLISARIQEENVMRTLKKEFRGLRLSFFVGIFALYGRNRENEL